MEAHNALLSISAVASFKMLLVGTTVGEMFPENRRQQLADIKMFPGDGSLETMFTVILSS